MRKAPPDPAHALPGWKGTVVVSISSLGAWVGQFWGRTANQVRADAQAIEAAGYPEIWISEAFGREVFSFAALLLASTERLAVATGIANIWGRDATTMMNAARTLAEAFPGRFTLGVGVSHGPLIDRRGHSYESPLKVMEEYLRALGRVEYSAPEPKEEPPVLVGALGDRMLGLCRDLADGAHPYLITPERTADIRKIVGPGRRLVPEQAFALTADRSDARAAGRAHLSTYLGLDNYIRNLRRQGFGEDDFVGGGSDRLIDALVAWGNEDQVLGRVREHQLAGADHVAIQPLPGEGLPEPIEQLRVIATALATQASPDDSSDPD